MNKFTKTATIYLFADQDTGDFHQYKISDEPRQDSFLTDGDLGLIRKFGASITGDGDHLTIAAPGVGTMSTIKKVEVLFNDDEDQFMMNGIVFDVSYDGGYFFTKAE